MSFQNLLDGDCGGQNPLVKIGSHFTQDQSFKQERSHPLSPDFSQAELISFPGMRAFKKVIDRDDHPSNFIIIPPYNTSLSSRDVTVLSGLYYQNGTVHHAAMVNKENSRNDTQPFRLVHEFLEDNLGQNVQTYRMDELFRELRDIESTTRSSISQAPNVAQLASEETSSLWSEQFLKVKNNELSLNCQTEGSILPVLREEVFGHEANIQQFQKNDTLKPIQAKVNDLGDSWSIDCEKLKNVDESQFGLGKEWVENFLKSGENEVSVGQSSMKEKEKDDVGSSKFIKFMKNSNTGEDYKKADKWTDEFIEKESVESKLENIWQKSSETSGVNNVEYFSQFWRKLQKEWEKISEDGEEPSWEKEYSEFIDPFKEYAFESENPMKELESPFEEGLRKLEENDLPSAVLCFEAAAQAEPNNPLVWQYLGTTQAENEQDPFAIAALKKCLTLQNDNLIALMSLAISYTNENYQNQACQMLRDWICYNPKYSDLVKEEKAEGYRQISSLLSPNIYNEVRDLYIKAANKYPFGEIDSDVQCGLGVLFNLSDEYDNAVDCFKAALQARPKDFRMWNRLGATLANGNRSEEAVDAYYNALHLSPGFIRARYNIGITCINLGANREAAEHLLTALNQQAIVNTTRGRVGAMSESIWTTLKFVINLLGKYELLQAVESRDLQVLNEEFKVKWGNWKSE